MHSFICKDAVLPNWMMSLNLFWTLCDAAGPQCDATGLWYLVSGCVCFVIHMYYIFQHSQRAWSSFCFGPG